MALDDDSCCGCLDVINEAVLDDETKKEINRRLFSTAVVNDIELKAVLHELELTGAAKADVEIFERTAKRRKSYNRSLRAEIQLFRAISRGELWRARMAVSAGVGRFDSIVVSNVQNGRRVRKNSPTMWQLLISRLKHQSGLNRQLRLAMLLLFTDKERLTAIELTEIEQFKEFAGFVYNK